MKELVVVVTDDPVLNEVVERWLIDSGYRVIVFENICESVDWMERKPFVLLITDLCMSMSKVSTLIHKVQKRISYRVPIMVLADPNAEQEINKLYDLGVRDIVTKPFREKELYFRVKSSILITEELRRRSNFLFLGKRYFQYPD